MENEVITAMIAVAMALFAWCGWRVGATRAASYFGGCVCLILVAGAYVVHHPALLPEWAIGAPAFIMYTTWYAPFASALFYLGASNAALRIPAERKTRA